MQLQRRGGDVLLLGHGEEVEELAQFHTPARGCLHASRANLRNQFDRAKLLTSRLARPSVLLMLQTPCYADVLRVADPRSGTRLCEAQRAVPTDGWNSAGIQFFSNSTIRGRQPDDCAMNV